MIRKLFFLKAFSGILIFALLPYEAVSSGIYEGEYISAFGCGSWKVDKEFSERRDTESSIDWFDVHHSKSISFYEEGGELFSSVADLVERLEPDDIKYAEIYGYRITSFRYGGVEGYGITDFTSSISLRNFSQEEFEEFAGECVDVDRIVWRLYADEVKGKDDK